MALAASASAEDPFFFSWYRFRGQDGYPSAYFKFPNPATSLTTFTVYNITPSNDYVAAGTWRRVGGRVCMRSPQGPSSFTLALTRDPSLHHRFNLLPQPSTPPTRTCTCCPTTRTSARRTTKRWG